MSSRSSATVSLSAASHAVSSRAISSNTFALVLLSTVLKAFLAGFAPQWFPLYCVVQFPVLLYTVASSHWRERKLLYFLELCWVFNAIGYFGVLPHELLCSSGLIDPLMGDEARMKMGAAFFVIATGPVAVTVLVNSYLLVRTWRPDLFESV